VRVEPSADGGGPQSGTTTSAVSMFDFLVCWKGVEQVAECGTV